MSITRQDLEFALTVHGVTPDHELTPFVFYDFLEWSRLDQSRHQGLATLSDWAEEFAEFDAAYHDWKAVN